MCVFHKWPKWEECVMEMSFTDLKTSKEIPYQNIYQKRHCEKCNKVQHELVREGLVRG